MLLQDSSNDVFYNMDPSSIKVDDAAGTVQAELNLNCSDATSSYANTLELLLNFY